MSFASVLRAYGIAVGAFSAMHLGITALVRNLAEEPVYSSSFLLLLSIAAYSLYLVTGFLVGVILKHRNIVNGTVAAVLAAMVAIVAFGVSSNDQFGIIALLVNGAVLGGVGGAFSLILRPKGQST